MNIEQNIKKDEIIDKEGYVKINEDNNIIKNDDNVEDNNIIEQQQLIYNPELYDEPNEEGYK